MSFAKLMLLTLFIIAVSATVITVWVTRRRTRRSAQRRQEPVFSKETQRTVAKKDVIYPVIALHLWADPARPYQGYELLQALFAAGLRFGEKNIFHYYLDGDEENSSLFSLASAFEPGSFEMGRMGEFTTQGLILFMQILPERDNLYAFATLLETSERLVNDLGGTLQDDRREALTQERVVHWRELIQNYSVHEREPDLFATQDQLTDVRS